MQPYQSCEQADSTHASTHEHDQLPMRWQLYVDGAWVPPDEEGKRPEGESPDAGYGVAELTICNSTADHTADDPAVPLTQITANSATNMADCMHGKVSWSLSGCVQTDPKEHDYVGAVGHTNNTGELSAIYWAIQRALQRPAQRGREEIHSDSLYGINMTTGVWVPKVPRTREMICLLRRSWRLLQRRRPREVRLCHVRSHIKVPGNEAADWLADTGRGGGNTGPAATARWLGNWLRDTQRDAEEDEGSGGAAGAPREDRPQVAQETGDIRRPPRRADSDTRPVREGGETAGGGVGWGVRGRRSATYRPHTTCTDQSGVG